MYEFISSFNLTDLFPISGKNKRLVLKIFYRKSVVSNVVNYCEISSNAKQKRNAKQYLSIANC